MKNNKLLETISILDTLERKRFRNVIKNKRRQSLVSLYELCLSRIEKELPLPEKEDVYLFLFEEKYSKKNDFLLRNEYRLLTDEAEEFLRVTAVEKYYPGIAEAARLRRILDSGNFSLFKKEFDVLSQKYTNDLLFWQSIDMPNLFFHITNTQMSVPNFQEIKLKAEACKNRLALLYNRQLSDFEVKAAYAEKVISVLSDTPITAIPSATVKTKEPDDLVEYRKLKALTYYYNGNEKIDILLKAEKILRNKIISQVSIDEPWWLQATAGLEYYLQYDFKNAILHFDRLFTSPGIEKFNRLPEAALNYLSALMSVGDYGKAVQAIIPFEERMTSSPPVFYKYICLKSLALSFLGKAQAARKELNRVEEHVVDFDFLYWRMSMILSFAVDKRWDDAQNEFKNMAKTKTVKQNSRPDLDKMILATDQLIKIGIAKEDGKTIPAKTYAQCEKVIDEMLTSPGDFLHPPKLIKKLLEELKEK